MLAPFAENVLASAFVEGMWVLAFGYILVQYSSPAVSISDVGKVDSLFASFGIDIYDPTAYGSLMAFTASNIICTTRC